MSSASTPGWTFHTPRYRCMLNFRTRADCVRHAFETASGRLKNITLIHPDGTEERVSREEYDANRTN